MRRVHMNLSPAMETSVALPIFFLWSQKLASNEALDHVLYNVHIIQTEAILKDVCSVAFNFTILCHHHNARHSNFQRVEVARVPRLP
jgi:hypothetical protein